MNYKNDFVLPHLVAKVKARTEKLKHLSVEEEGKLLSLTAQQKEVISKSDKVLKDEYITTAPTVHSPSLKSHNKYKTFTDLLHSLN